MAGDKVISFVTPLVRKPTKDEQQYAECGQMQMYHKSWSKNDTVFCVFCNGWQEKEWADNCILFKEDQKNDKNI